MNRLAATLLLLTACPAAEDPDSTDPAGTAAWEGSIDGRPLAGSPSAIYVRSGTGTLISVNPGMSVDEIVSIGVEYDPSVTVLITEIPDPCATLAEYMQIASTAMGISPDLEALGALPTLLPDQYSYVTFSLGAEADDALATSYTLGDSVEGPDGFHLASTSLSSQIQPLDWEALFQGADLESYMTYAIGETGTIMVDEVDLGAGVIGGEAEITAELGGMVAVTFSATHCPALEDALSVFLNP